MSGHPPSSAQHHGRNRNLKYQFPPMLRLTTTEAQCIANIFRLYDSRATGSIPDYLAAKVCQAIGMTVHASSFSTEVSLQELILLLDRLVPEPEPALLSSLTTFNQLAATTKGELRKQARQKQRAKRQAQREKLNRPKSSDVNLINKETKDASDEEDDIQNDDDDEIVITAGAISQFMESLGRPPASTTEAELLLNTMLDYDDCADTPMVGTERFVREVINFAKKTNAFKDYRG